jgi:hypothetical protein
VDEASTKRDALSVRPGLTLGMETVSAFLSYRFRACPGLGLSSLKERGRSRPQRTLVCLSLLAGGSASAAEQAAQPLRERGG